MARPPFWSRRKTLVKALSESPHVNLSRDFIREILIMLKIDLKDRGERLTVEQYTGLAKKIYERRS